MNFKQWIIAESSISQAEALYQKFVDDEISLKKLGPVILRAIEKWYEKQAYHFDYEEFKSRVVAEIKKRNPYDSVREILTNVGDRLERRRLKGGIRMSDEEDGEKHDKSIDIVPKTIEKPISIEKPIPVEKIPVAVELPKPLPKPLPIPEPVKQAKFNFDPVPSKKTRPWQASFDFDPNQRKLF